MVRKRKPPSLSDVLREEVKHHNTESSSLRSSPETVVISNETIATSNLTPLEVESPQNTPEREKNELEVSQNNELQNRVIDLESKLQQQKNLVTNLQTEVKRNQELQKQLETQQRLIRELQDKLQQEKEAKQEKEVKEPQKSLEIVIKPKYGYIMPNRPMTRLLDNPSAAKNLSNEEIGWFD
jgi:DNA repair exonuclease SbcCD ATPase subunit